MCGTNLNTVTQQGFLPAFLPTAGRWCVRRTLPGAAASTKPVFDSTTCPCYRKLQRRISAKIHLNPGPQGASYAPKKYYTSGYGKSSKSISFAKRCFLTVFSSWYSTRRPITSRTSSVERFRPIRLPIFGYGPPLPPTKNS